MLLICFCNIVVDTPIAVSNSSFFIVNDCALLYTPYEYEVICLTGSDTTFFNPLCLVSLLAVSEYENLLKQYTDQTKLKEDIENKLQKVFFIGQCFKFCALCKFLMTCQLCGSSYHTMVSL